MATIKADDIPLDKLDAVIERLQKEKNTRIDAAVAAGEAVRVPVSIVGDQDVEYWKARARQDANVPPGKAVHFDITYYKYQDMPDGSPNPMNKMSPLEDGRVIEIRTGVNRSPEWGQRNQSGDDPNALQNQVATFVPESGRRYGSDNAYYPKPPKPPELIVGEPRPVWTEMRRPGPNHHGEIAEGFYIVVDGRVHLSDELGKAIPGFSDVAGIDPLNRARKLLRGKAMQNRPDEFWRMSPVAPRHGGW